MHSLDAHLTHEVSFVLECWSFNDTGGEKVPPTELEDTRLSAGNRFWRMLYRPPVYSLVPVSVFLSLSRRQPQYLEWEGGKRRKGSYYNLKTTAAGERV